MTISEDLLAILRCPLDPKNARLELSADGLVCQCCRVVFPFREEIPCLRPEEAKLPQGCNSLNDLPCRQKKQG